MNQNLASARQVHANARQFCRHTQIDTSIAERAFALRERGANHVRKRVRLEFQLHFARIQPRHFGGFANQPVQAIAFFVDDRQQFASLLIRSAQGSKANSSPKP